MSNNNFKTNEFIGFLKQFEMEILNMPYSYVDPCKENIAVRLDHIFDKYIDIENTSKPQMNHIMELISQYGIHNRVKNLIMSVWIYQLRKSETTNNYMVKKALVEDHLFKLIR
jgi:hypothetical protein